MPFADEMIGPEVASRLSQAMHQVLPNIKLPRLAASASSLTELSLRDRVQLLHDALLDEVPGDYAAFAATVRQARISTSDFSGWLIWPVTTAVATRAVQENTAESFMDALALLAELTEELTAEFALRTLLRHDLPAALKQISLWTSSPNEHVRRLASEGTRLFLPWAIRVPALAEHPEYTVPILNALYQDPSDYVRRSVANHLNDLSRDHPELVLQTVRGWNDAKDQNTPALLRHALRTLVKRGNVQALEVLGFAPVSVQVHGPQLEDQRIGFSGALKFSAELTNTGEQPAKMVVDYVIHHRRANGTTSPKVFKLTTATLPVGEKLQLTKEHSFRPITTRRYYPGEQHIALQVNGVPTELISFELLPPAVSPTNEGLNL